MSTSGGPSPGTVTSVTAADTSIVVANPTTTPTVRTNTLDVIATQHPPAAAVAMNAQKITGLANGSASTDGAAFGQIPVPANGYGITGNTGATPTPAVALTTDAKAMAADTTLGTASGLVTVLTSNSLAIGTWLVVARFFSDPQTGFSSQVQLTAVVNSATATFAGQTYDSYAILSGAGFTAQSLGLAMIVTVTSAGTIDFQMENRDITATVVVPFRTLTNPRHGGASGYSAIRVG